MAMQLGLSRVLLIAGAGYGGSIFVRNGGKLSDVISELQALLNGSGEQSDGDADKASQMYMRLLDELRNARQTVVLNTSGGQGGNMSSLIVPVATVGAVGYGYMWWKGLKFTDLMYVTKKNLNSAVTGLKGALENVTELVEKTKKHLTQRIQNLDDKVQEQNDLSKLIKNDVAGVQNSITDLDFTLSQLKSMVSGLDWRLCSIQDQQDLTNMGVAYLCNVVGDKVGMPAALQKQLKDAEKVDRLKYSEPACLMGLKELTDTLSVTLSTDGIVTDDIGKLVKPPRNLLRSVSSKC